MDARLDPAKYAGLAERDAHVIRNAGGRATDDAIRSLIISHKLLGTKEWFVVHHTNCGMELFSDEIIADLLEDDLGTAAFDGKKWANPRHRAVTRPATSSNGTRSRTSTRALSTTSSESGPICSSPPTCLFTVTSTTSRPAA
jgi:carbonic anhydrase